MREAPLRFDPEELRDGGTDAGLLLLSLVTPRGVELSQGEIAFVCGCSKAYIYLVEKRAKEKLRRALMRRREVREAVGDMD